MFQKNTSLTSLCETLLQIKKVMINVKIGGYAFAMHCADTLPFLLPLCCGKVTLFTNVVPVISSIYFALCLCCVGFWSNFLEH
jgi:hypothetical protein